MIGSVVVVFFDWFLQNFNRLRGFGIENRGVSFGLVGELSIYLRFLLPIFVLFVCLWFWKKRLYENIYLLVMLVGGVGNAVPRAVWGYVWDYIQLPYFDLWINFSDVLISISVLSYILVGDDYDTDTA